MFEKYANKFFKTLFIIALSICFKGNAQSKKSNDYSSNDIENLINSNPVQSLDMAQLLLSKPNITSKDKAKLIFLIYKAYKAKGNTKIALNFLYEEKKYDNYLSEQDKIDIEIEKIKLLRALFLNKQSKLIIKNLENQIKNISDTQLKSHLKTAILIEQSKDLILAGKYEKAVNLLENIENSSKYTFASYPDLKHDYLLTLGNLYLNRRELSKAEKTFNLALASLDKQKKIDLYLKTMALSGVAEVYFYQNKYEEALSVLKKAFLNSKTLYNVLLQETVLHQQINNYLALNDSKNFKQIKTSYIRAQSQYDSINQEAFDASYDLILKENSALYSEKENKYFTILYILISACLLMIVGYVFMWRKYSERHKNLEEIIKYIEITRGRIYNAFPIKKIEIKKSIISKELEDEILNKLKQFESTKKFVNKDISLSILAVQFNTNVKYLSDIINSNYNLNFNTYINTLRINYIIEKLKTDPDFINYKISYLADYCGFSAHSSFATVFKSITGISPVKFIELLKDEKENTLLP